MKIVLYRPQIPQNTGNVVRTCKVTGTELVLVRPLGFHTDDRSLKRAGLDYWDGVPVTEIDDLMQYLEEQQAPFIFFSSHATRPHWDMEYPSESVLIFGSESAGLPSAYFEKWPERFVTLPMIEGSRCLNLATTVGIGLYEALRQQSVVSSGVQK